MNWQAGSALAALAAATGFPVVDDDRMMVDNGRDTRIARPLTGGGRIPVAIKPILVPLESVFPHHGGFQFVL